MRLEDWQRWLDTQFIDPADAQPQSQPPAQAEPAMSESAAREPAPAASAVAVMERPTEQRESAVATLAPPVAPPEPVYVPPAEVQRPTPAAAPPQPQISHVEDIQIPSIEQYMPFLRQRISDAAPAPTEEEPASETITAHEMLSVDVDARTIETVIAEPEAEAAQTELPLSEESRDSQPSPASQQRYQLTYRRARHARSVRPTEVVPELKSGDLWNLVPKHIQSLVAIGSADDEVAQNSYKRSFRESRLELIGRLLDPTLSLEETARLLNVCPTTVRRYTNKGLLTHQRTAGDQRRFKLSDVLAFLEAQSRVGGPA